MTGGSAISDRSLRIITTYSLLGGATALVPIPFFDEWLLRRIKRLMVKSLLSDRHSSVAEDVARELLPNRSRFETHGCFSAFLFYLVIVPVKFLGYLLIRIFRTLLFFLAFKYVTDRASEVFHFGYLVHCASDTISDPGPLSPAQLKRLRNALDQTLRDLNTSPVYRIFASVIRLHMNALRSTARRLRQLGRRRSGSDQGDRDKRIQEMVRDERTPLGRLAHQIADLIAGERDYLTTLEQRFRVRLQG